MVKLRALWISILVVTKRLWWNQCTESTDIYPIVCQSWGCPQRWGGSQAQRVAPRSRGNTERSRPGAPPRQPGRVLEDLISCFFYGSAHLLDDSIAGRYREQALGWKLLGWLLPPGLAVSDADSADFHNLSHQKWKLVRRSNFCHQTLLNVKVCVAKMK